MGPSSVMNAKHAGIIFYLGPEMVDFEKSYHNTVSFTYLIPSVRILYIGLKCSLNPPIWSCQSTESQKWEISATLLYYYYAFSLAFFMSSKMPVQHDKLDLGKPLISQRVPKWDRDIHRPPFRSYNVAKLHAAKQTATHGEGAAAVPPPRIHAS